MTLPLKRKRNCDYLEGREARINGRTLADNPHFTPGEPFTVAAGDWTRGFVEAALIVKGIWYGVNTGAKYEAAILPSGLIEVTLLHPNTLEKVHVTGHVRLAMFDRNYVRREELEAGRK